MGLENSPLLMKKRGEDAHMCFIFFKNVEQLVWLIFKVKDTLCNCGGMVSSFVV